MLVIFSCPKIKIQCEQKKCFYGHNNHQKGFPFFFGQKKDPQMRNLTRGG